MRYAPTELCLDLLADLVAFDTTSRRSNLPIIEWVASYLASHGIASETIPDASGEKANLMARVGPDVPGGILLCGHTDTVPVDCQPWTTDPFRLERRGDRVFGRGTVDMKGFIACTMAAVRDLAGASLTRPVWLGLTYDEELGCLGVPSLAARLRAEAHPPAFAIVGEATGMGLVRAHKGGRAFRTKVVGRDAHSSRPQTGANAIVAAARIATRIAELAAAHQRAGPRAEGFSPPYTTFNVGTIAGGQAINIVARECELLWEFRFVPSEDPDAVQERLEAFIHTDVLPDLQAAAPEASVTLEAVARMPALDPAGNAAAAALVERITGVKPSPPVAYSTDGGALSEAGIPTLIAGPGEATQMHQPDESIHLSQLGACERFLARIAARATSDQQLRTEPRAPLFADR